MRVPSYGFFISPVNSMVKLAPDLRSIVNNDGGVVLNNAHNQITTLDAMGGYIWRQLENGISEEALIEHLVAETGEATEVVKRDVQELLGDLAYRHLVVDAEPEVTR